MGVVWEEAACTEAAVEGEKPKEAARVLVQVEVTARAPVQLAAKMEGPFPCILRP